MKKITLLSFMLALFFPITLFSQGISLGLQPANGNKHYYVGSLLKSGNPHGKLKIEVFGGNVHNSNLGTAIFTISTRDGLRIHKEVQNGSSRNYMLNIFETSDKYEFTIYIPSQWATIWLQSHFLNPNFDGVPRIMTALEPREYDALNKKNVTNQFPIHITMSTFDNGNIGIGTDMPQAKLDVNGTIRAKEVKIEATGWADFVFAPDYNLPSLSEVKKHIEEKQHLPNIPSASEVKENGVDVGEMQVKLLQKIEELTLYVIELNNMNSKLEQRVKELENKQ